MPQLGYDMTEATLIRWLKREGDSVVVDDIIAEIETDKAIVELGSTAAGALLKLLVDEGETVPVGSSIAFVGEAGEPLPDVQPAPAPSARATPNADYTSHHRRAPAEHATSRVRSSPLARKLAAESGLDITLIAGTGPDGRVTRDDVLAAANSASTPKRAVGGEGPRAPGPDGKIPLGRMGQAVARRTQATMNEVPHFYETVEIDMTDAVGLRAWMNEGLAPGDRITLNDFVMKACALALAKYPAFNATFEGDHLRVQPHINIGIAVALPDGLVVPAIPECERKSVMEIAKAAKDLAQRATNGTLRQDEYSGTFSVSNLGMFGVASFTAIIVSPQVAVLAVGAAHPTPVARGAEVVIREMMSATLSADHRAVHGAEAAQFLVEIRRILEDPQAMDASV